MSIVTKTIGLKKLSVTIPLGGGPIVFSTANIYTPDIEIYNSGTHDMFIGNSSVDTSWIPLATTKAKNITHGTGTFLGRDPVLSFNLKNLYVKGTAGEVLIVQYIAAEDTVSA